MSTIGDVTLLISTIATSAGTIFGIGLSVYTLRRKEGQYFRIDIREHQSLVNPLPGYSADRYYTNLRVINLGGRPVRISTAGYMFFNHTSGGIFSDSLQYSGQSIDVDGARDYLGDETQRPKHKIAYYYATSLTGMTRRKYMVPRVIVWVRDFLHWGYIYRKKRSTGADG